MSLSEDLLPQICCVYWDSETVSPRINCGRSRGGGKSCPRLTDDQLKSAAHGLAPRDADVVETFALTAVIAERVLGLRMFDVQILGALALHAGISRRCRPAKARRWRPCPP